jgi:glycosyltransferase involved in cell wall biosynthesis
MVPQATVREWHFPSAPSGADPVDVARLRQSLGLRPSDQIVLYSGTFEAYQGLPELIGAIPLVRQRFPDVTFVFVGAASSEPELASAAPYIESGALRVVDRQPRHEMPAFLAMADVLVSARAYGGNLPLKIFDYLAASRPIVATDIPTHRTVLSEERAVLVPPSTEALAQGIVGVLADPERGRQLAAAGREYAKTHLGWGRFVRAVSELYNEVERHAIA